MEFTMIDGLLGDDGKLGPVQMRSALRLSIAAEQDAVSLYEMIARATDDPQVRKLMSDIAAEQKVHLGQFKKLLDDRDPDDATKQAEGRQQAGQKVGRGDQGDRMRDLAGL